MPSIRIARVRAACRPVLALALVAGGAAGCAATRVVPGPPIDAEASGHLYDAWRAQRAGDATALAGLVAARDAAASDPSWIAPQRLIDDILRAELRGPEALARRLEALAERPEDAAANYLAGRLGGPDSERLLDRAAALDPSLGWAWHGLAWNAHRKGQNARALTLGRAALNLTRDPHETTHFAYAFTRYLIASDRSDAALRLLDSLVRGVAEPQPQDPRVLRPEERVHLAVELGLGELASGTAFELSLTAGRGTSGEAQGGGAASSLQLRSPLRLRGARRGLELLATPGTTAEERLALVRALARRPEVTRDELLLALAGAAVHMGDDRTAALRGELLALQSDTVFSDTLRAEGEGLGPSARERVVDAFRGGEPLGALEEWLAELPAGTRDDAGRPRAAHLAEVLDATRAAAPLATAAETERIALAEALLAAGWFDEAFALSLRGVLPRAAADDVLRRALAERTALKSIETLLEAVDAGLPTELVVPEGGAPFEVGLARVRSLSGLLDAVRRRLVERRVLGGLAPEVADLAEESPRIGYGPVATVVHPGPTFSAEDAQLGRGVEGAPVPGLAAELAPRGRIALFGNALGQGGPDGAILRLVHTELRVGEHLGRPFRGTVFWCYGADVPARFARRGASISGAALHEGFWIDLERVEAERAGWRRVLRQFSGDAERVRAALDVVGPRVVKELRAAIEPTLGANDRMRLAWMVARGEAAAPELVSLGELAEVVAVHEEGHLCDRAGWYPFRFHLRSLIVFAASLGFQPGRIAEALEERAQLVALCCAPDPRLAWVDLLDAVERSGPSITPHAAGYRRVLERLLARMSRELDEGEWPELDGERRLVDQLHRVGAERLRGVAIREAATQGLVR